MTVDLSRYHEPLTDLFPGLRDKELLTEFQLTSEQLEFYHQNGYIAGVHLLDDEQIKRLREELTELTNPDHPGRSLLYEYNSNE